MNTFPIIDLHTDILLADRGLGAEIFNIDTSAQITHHMAQKAGAILLFSGISYDDMNGCTERMLVESRIQNSGLPKLVTHIEGAQILSSSMSLSDAIEKGVRSIGLVHSHDNSLAGSSSTDTNLGLSKRGKALVKEALREGVLVDLAHMSNKAFLESAALISKPLIISHTAAYSVEKNPRNTNDEQLKIVARSHGFVGIFFSGKYINSQQKPTINDVIKHIRHMVSIAGIDHVGIGSDFGGITSGPITGIASYCDLQNLFTALLSSGFSKREVEKISYQNAKRVLTEWGIL